VLALVALYALGMWLASLFLLYGREVWHLGNAFQEPVYLASGMYFPLSALGPWSVVGLSVLPLTLGLDALRQLLVGRAARGWLPVRAEELLLVLCVAVFPIVAAASWRAMEERAKREGKLLLRWQ
jgi:ABC-2 type transport system permease protein